MLEAMINRSTAGRSPSAAASAAGAGVTGIARRLDPDDGAQAAEYAMLGGVSAAACSALVVLLRNPDTISGIVEAVVSALGGLIGSWF